MRFMLFVMTGVWVFGANAGAQSSVAAPTLSWGAAPPMFPVGAKIAVVRGDPGRPGRFTAELSMPDGYRWPAHFHIADELMEVKQGTCLFGERNRVDLAKARALAVGDTVIALAGMHHFGVARGATIISVTITGPYVITYVNGAEGPQRTRSFPFD